jgi:hypothetical protein
MYIDVPGGGKKNMTENMDSPMAPCTANEEEAGGDGGGGGGLSRPSSFTTIAI